MSQPCSRVLPARCAGKKHIQRRSWLEPASPSRAQAVEAALGICLIPFFPWKRGSRTARGAASEACWLCWPEGGQPGIFRAALRCFGISVFFGISGFLGSDPSLLCCEGCCELPSLPVSLRVAGAGQQIPWECIQEEEGEPHLGQSRRGHRGVTKAQLLSQLSPWEWPSRSQAQAQS